MGDFVFSPCSPICVNTDIQAHAALEWQWSLYFLLCTGAVASAAFPMTASAKGSLGADPGICWFQFVFVIKEPHKQTEQIRW